jgi:MoaA/NifB/PqqE/SkfB family radical SAM enzyme
MADELKIQWNIGNDCNYNCSYCHSDLKNGSNPFPNLDKLRVGFDNIIRQAQPFSLVHIELIGGEITQSPAIKELLLTTKNPKINFRIYSNGSADVAWWEEVRLNIYQMDLTYHPSSDLTHFVSVVKAINKIAGEGLNIIIAAPHDNWDRAIEAYTELKPFNPTLQMLYSNFTRGNSKYYEYTGAQWSQFRTLSGIEESTTKEFKKVHRLNNFYGHLCWAGVEQIVINNFGDVYRGWCFSGTSLGNIFNDTFVLDAKPRPCPKDQCNNGFDLNVRKSKQSWGMA